MRLVLWENDAERVTSGGTYHISNVMVREFDGKKYLTLNKKSIVETSDEAIEREDDINIDNNLSKVNCPAEGVENIKRFLSCNKCQTKIVAVPDKNIVKCSECGLTQLKTKCKQRVLATVLFANGVSTVMFDDKLRQLHNIFRETNSSKEFSQLDDDELCEVILTVEALVYYNNKFNVITVAKTNT